MIPNKHDTSERAELARRLPNSEVYTDTETRVLLALMEQGHPTVRSIGQRVVIGVSSTHKHLSRLRDAGLIAWDVGHDATLRATHEVVAVAR